MTAHLFAYGSLRLGQVLAAVTGAAGPCAPALLRDHARYGLRGQTYPGLVPAAGQATDGVLWFDVDAAAWRRLDASEGDWYAPTPVEVLVDGQPLPARTYVLVEAQRHRLNRRRWSLQRFEARHLTGFLRDHGGVAALPPTSGETP